jgi:hypothetical protein
MMFGTAKNRVVKWRATFAVRQNSEKQQILDLRARLFGGSSDMVC